MMPYRSCNGVRLAPVGIASVETPKDRVLFSNGDRSPYMRRPSPRLRPCDSAPYTGAALASDPAARNARRETNLRLRVGICSTRRQSVLPHECSCAARLLIGGKGDEAYAANRRVHFVEAGAVLVKPIDGCGAASSGTPSFLNCLRCCRWFAARCTRRSVGCAAVLCEIPNEVVHRCEVNAVNKASAFSPLHDETCAMKIL